MCACTHDACSRRGKQVITGWYFDRENHPCSRQYQDEKTFLMFLISVATFKFFDQLKSAVHGKNRAWVKFEQRQWIVFLNEFSYQWCCLQR